MKKNFFYFCAISFAGFLLSCDGNLNMSSQSSTHSESSISENSEIIMNGDTTIKRKSRKEKNHSESENRTSIGFSTEDKTGISDAVRKKLKSQGETGEDGATEQDTTKKGDTKQGIKKTKKKTLLKSKIECEAPISGDDFENAKAKFQKAKMDMDMVRKGKEIFNGLCITSKQARELVSVLSLDNHKLELAKFLYGRTTNKEKFMSVADEFSFDDTKKKLSSYLQD